MAVSESDYAAKLRSIEVAIDNFESRLQGTLSSQVSLLKGKTENLVTKVVSTTGKNQTQQSGSEQRNILEEIKALIQKDLFQDSSQLLKERLAEIRSLVSRLRAVSAELLVACQGEPEQKRLFTPQSNVTGPQPNHIGIDPQRDAEISSLREEINRLYNLTEREPRFQAFWILRDAFPSWLQISKIARTLNATPNEVHSNLTVFERIGLVEIKEGEARAIKLVRPNKPMTNK